MEHHDFIDTIQKFRFEHPADLFHNAGLHPLVVLLLIFFRDKSQTLRLYDRLCPRIGSHDNDRLFKIYFSALRIRNMSVIQHLQKNVEHIRMCLFNLIKEKHTIRIPPYLLTELTAFFVSHISGRRTDQLGDTVLFHIFGHVHTDHGLFRAEYSLCQRFGQLRLTYAGRSQKQKRTDGTGWILQADSSSFYRLCHRSDCFLLTHDTLVENLFQPGQPTCLSLGQTLNRYLCPV